MATNVLIVSCADHVHGYLFGNEFDPSAGIIRLGKES